jgi:predicted Zn-dependent protease
MRKFFVIVLVLAFGYGAYQWFVSSSRLCQIMFVPIGDFPPASLQAVANYYQETLGVKILLSGPIPIEEGMLDRRRGQLIGQELINHLRWRFPEPTKNLRLMMIGFTREDMYIRDKDWRFAFAYRENGRFAAISTARMDPVNFGLLPNDGVLVRRLIKMTSKQIGLYFYRLPERQEKTSVLFSPILGVDDLDEVAMDFDAVDRKRIGNAARQCSSNWLTFIFFGSSI